MSNTAIRLDKCKYSPSFDSGVIQCVETETEKVQKVKYPIFHSEITFTNYYKLTFQKFQIFSLSKLKRNIVTTTV